MTHIRLSCNSGFSGPCHQPWHIWLTGPSYSISSAEGLGSSLKEEDVATVLKSDINAEAGLHFSLPSGEMEREDSSQNRNYIHHCTHPSPAWEVLTV